MREEHSSINRCVGEAFKKLLVEMSLDCGDSLLLCGILAKDSAKWFLRRKAGLFICSESVV